MLTLLEWVGLATPGSGLRRPSEARNRNLAWVTHFAGETGKWFHENWRTIVVIAVVIVVTYFTLGTGDGRGDVNGEAILLRC